MVTFNPDERVEDVMERGSRERTTLTAFFAANADQGRLGVEARKHTYQEFPQYLAYDKTAKAWHVRQARFALGRMYWVSPLAGEWFYLRVLLAVVRGAKSFEDLRSYDGTCFTSFLAACLARGLLEDDGEWHQCLEDACQMQTGFWLRLLFTILLLFCHPSKPDTLWNKFQPHICDDLHYQLQQMGIRQPSTEDVYDYGLHLLDSNLRQAGAASVLCYVHNKADTYQEPHFANGLQCHNHK